MAYTIPLPNLTESDYTVPSAGSLNSVAERLARMRASFDPVEFQRRIAAAPSAEARMELQAQYNANLRAIANAENYLLQSGYQGGAPAPDFFTERERQAADRVEQMLSPDYGMQLEPPERKPAYSPPRSPIWEFLATPGYKLLGRQQEERQARALEREDPLARPFEQPEQAVPPGRPGAPAASGPFNPPAVAARRGREDESMRAYQDSRQTPFEEAAPEAALVAAERPKELAEEAFKLPRTGLAPEEIAERRKEMDALRKGISEQYEKARKGIADIALEKPTFEAGFGRVDPGMALALAGLSMFQPGKSAAEAIASGAKTGLMQLGEERKIAAAQQREMREAQRQFVSDSMGKAKALADIDLRSTDSALKVQELEQRHEEAIRTGNYRDASLLLDRMRLEVSRSAQPAAVAQKLTELDKISQDKNATPEARASAAAEAKNLRELTRAGATEASRDRLAVTIIKDVDASLSKDPNYMGLLPDRQKQYRAAKLREAFAAAGLSLPSFEKSLPDALD